jgi:hypothetical protein
MVEEIEGFINDERIQKFGARPFFCRKNGIFQSSLTLFLTGRQKNPKIHDLIADYLKSSEDEKKLFFNDFIPCNEKKRSIPRKGMKLRNPLLTMDESGILSKTK